MEGLNRAEIGWLGELVLDQALVIGSGGRLLPWIPLVDAHGIDRAYSWDGIGSPTFTQVKFSQYERPNGRHHWDFRAGSFPRHLGFYAVLGVFDSLSTKDEQPFWCVDSETVLRIAERHHDAAGRTIYRLEGSLTHNDRLAKYRYARSDVWKLFAPSHDVAVSPLQQLPKLRIDQGGLYEFALMTELLKANHKDLLLFRPAFDTAGRDLLLHLVGTPCALYLQIKGTALRRENGSVHFSVHRSTFVPAQDFWLVLVFWEPRLDRFFPECWLVPSFAVEQRMAARGDAPYLTIDAHLDRAVDRWAEFRHPIAATADVLRQALGDLRLAA